MEIDKNLYQYGVNENVINFIHSRAKLSSRKIISANLYRVDSNELIVKVTIENTRKYNQKREVSYSISMLKLREIKLNLILN